MESHASVAKVDAKREIREADSLVQDGPVSLYLQLGRALENRILSGTLSSGDQLPTELELVTQFEVSRTTCRLAFDYLVRRGLVTRKQGKGTFVANRETALIGLEAMRAPSGVEDATGYRRVLRAFGPARADGSVVSALGIRDTDVTYLERVHFIFDRPLALVQAYYPSWLPEVTEEQARKHTSHEIVELLMGFDILESSLAIRAVIPPPAVCEPLELREGDPALLFERISYAEAGRPLEFTRLYARTDHRLFRLKLKGHMPITTRFEGL